MFDRLQIGRSLGIEERVDAYCAQKATVGVRVLGRREAPEIVIDPEVNECVTILQSADAGTYEFSLFHLQRANCVGAGVVNRWVIGEQSRYGGRR